MKKVLITGKDSYIGTNFKKYLEQYPDDYYVEELDVRDEDWKQFDFSKFDIVFHVAGLAHLKEIKENEILYYKVNRDLSIAVANKAKESNVKQFVFMSSMSVYGLTYSKNLITKETECHPNTYYGTSKYQAEIALNKLVDDNFNVCLVRPPMVYGNNSPGNLTKLFKTVRKFHIFPTIRNQRSSITIEKLCEVIKLYISKDIGGIQIPQNDNYMCTYEIVKKKMDEEDIKVIYVPFCNLIIKMMIGKIGLITKCFGDLKYGK